MRLAIAALLPCLLLVQGRLAQAALDVKNPFVAELQLSPDLSKPDLAFSTGSQLAGMADAQMSSLLVRPPC